MSVGDLTLEPSLLYLAAVVFLGYLVQTVTGFGSALICVTLGALAIPIEELLPMIVPLSFLQTSYVVIRHRRHIAWGLLLKRVLPVMGVGLLVGMYLFRGVAGSGLRYAFAAMVFLLAARELWRMLRADATSPGKLPTALSIAAIFGAGITHGIYASGGPLLVYATGREGLDKEQFRATLCTVWLTLNVVLVAGFALDGAYDVGRMSKVGLLMLAVPLGIVLGERLHARVDERRFKLGVYGLLILAAMSLTLK